MISDRRIYTIFSLSNKLSIPWILEDPICLLVSVAESLQMNQQHNTRVRFRLATYRCYFNNRMIYPSEIIS